MATAIKSELIALDKLIQKAKAELCAATTPDEQREIISGVKSLIGEVIPADLIPLSDFIILKIMSQVLHDTPDGT